MSSSPPRTPPTSPPPLQSPPLTHPSIRRDQSVIRNTLQEDGPDSPWIRDTQRVIFNEEEEEEDDQFLIKNNQKFQHIPFEPIDSSSFHLSSTPSASNTSSFLSSSASSFHLSSSTSRLVSSNMTTSVIKFDDDDLSNDRLEMKNNNDISFQYSRNETSQLNHSHSFTSNLLNNIQDSSQGGSFLASSIQSSLPLPTPPPYSHEGRIRRIIEGERERVGEGERERTYQASSSNSSTISFIDTSNLHNPLTSSVLRGFTNEEMEIEDVRNMRSIQDDLSYTFYPASSPTASSSQIASGTTRRSIEGITSVSSLRYSSSSSSRFSYGLSSSNHINKKLKNDIKKKKIKELELFKENLTETFYKNNLELSLFYEIKNNTTKEKLNYGKNIRGSDGKIIEKYGLSDLNLYENINGRTKKVNEVFYEVFNDIKNIKKNKDDDDNVNDDEDLNEYDILESLILTSSNASAIPSSNQDKETEIRRNVASYIKHAYTYDPITGLKSSKLVELEREDQNFLSALVDDLDKTSWMFSSGTVSLNNRGI